MQQTAQEGALQVAVDLLIFSERGGELLLMLGRRGEAPFQGCWALPGRIVRQDESAEMAVSALLDEMFPVHEAFIEQLYTFTGLSRDPRGRVISIAYLVILPWNRMEEALRDEKLLLRPFSLRGGSEGVRLSGEGQDLRGSDLAFDHGRIAETGLKRLQGKAGYSDICFAFLPSVDCFSLSALQEVFGAILQKPLDASNFRRFVHSRWGESGRLQPISRENKRGRGRPAVLYRLTDKED